MKHILTLLAVTFFSFDSFPQVRHEGDTVYKFSKSILNNLSGDPVPDYWKAAIDFSYIGDYKNALLFSEKTRSPFAEIGKSDSLYFSQFKPANAKDYILKRAANEQIIIINEAHHSPVHRVFIRSLLEGLFKAGYRYYGAETLNYLDSNLHERGYPILTSGYYSVEPQFGNLIRKAITAGFQLFAYEARSRESFMNPKTRELEMARNIMAVLKEDPDAKILIHAGYDHIREDSVGGTWEKAMAGRLKELTGIDPMTINQEILSERLNLSLENPFYRMTKVEVPSVFLNDSGEPFSGPEGTKYYDVRLAHPRTKYIKQRPDWLKDEDTKHIYLNDSLLTNCPCLLQAYNSGEDIKIAVPVDVVEILSNTGAKPLVLSAGDYVVIIKSQSGETKETVISVK